MIINKCLNILGINYIFPFYHTVSNEVLPHINKLYNYRNEKQFTNDLDYLLKNYIPITYNEFKLGKQKTRKSYFLLSFDDGFSEIYNVIAPILLKKGIPAIFFINTDFVDNKQLFFRCKASLLLNKITSSNSYQLKEIKNHINIKTIDMVSLSNFIMKINYEKIELLDILANILELDFADFLNINKPYLTTSQIKELSNKGFVFGGHSCSHPLFSEISLSQQIFEARESTNIVNKICNQNEKLFSFPFTDSGVTKDFFIESEKFLDFSFACAGIKKDIFNYNIQRIPVENYSNIETSLNKEFIKCIARGMLNKNTVVH
jgi:peptidoglycan/xylan/chitin deacetylase (PgdA/CDA1 family)